MKSLGLYIHIPFCKRKCYYCDFVSYPNKINIIDAYIDSIIKEASMYKDYISNHYTNTVFIGGGTPSLLSKKQIGSLVKVLEQAIGLSADEFTIEANPETLTEQKLRTYKDLGINRLSIGLQSHDDTILAGIGRRHTYKDFSAAYETACRYFDNMNVDIMFGLPGQTFDIFKETVRQVISLNPAHISCYALKLEEGTKLYKTFDGVDDITDRQMYHYAVSAIKDAGYEHYETSNFAKKGYECRHNLKYWTGDEYLGLGAAASSYNGTQRWTNTDSIDEYLSLIDENEKPVKDLIALSAVDKKQEYIMLRLRLSDGINLEDYYKTFGKSFLEEQEATIQILEKASLIVVGSASIKPTIKGFDLQNTLISEFMKNI